MFAHFDLPFIDRQDYRSGDLLPTGLAHSQYYIDIIGELLARYPESELKFILTTNYERLQRYGDDVVVLLFADEMYNIPRYADRVKWVFKTGGIRPPRPWSISGGSLVLGAAETLREARNRLHRWRSGGEARKGNISIIPLGPAIPHEPPTGQPPARDIDVLFAVRFASLSGFTPRPSVIARRRMLALAERLAATPGLNVRIHSNLPHHEPPMDHAAYNAALERSKIVLCPRGNFPETHRFYEAARAGAIPATDVLLATDFLDACPCLRIPSTNSAIAPILDRLGAGRWEGTCRAVRDWYCQHASPQAVAERAATTLGLASPDNMRATRR